MHWPVKALLPLRYDDRGWNDKNIDFGQFTTADFLQDAASALPLLRKRFNKVGILGHSEGRHNSHDACR